MCSDGCMDSVYRTDRDVVFVAYRTDEGKPCVLPVVRIVSIELTVMLCL